MARLADDRSPISFYLTVDDQIDGCRIESGRRRGLVPLTFFPYGRPLGAIQIDASDVIAAGQ